MSDECLKKQADLITLFASCANQEAKYQKIIELGKEMPRLAKPLKVEENRVQGCQSRMYLHSRVEGDRIYFEGDSDALISAGLAALLIRVYSGETAETILTCPPSYLQEVGIADALTPNRANGLYSIHLRMKQDAIKHLAHS